MGIEHRGMVRADGMAVEPSHVFAIEPPAYPPEALPVYGRLVRFLGTNPDLHFGFEGPERHRPAIRNSQLSGVEPGAEPSYWWDDPDCGFNFRISRRGVPVQFSVQGAGRLDFRADAWNAEALSCTARTRDCTRNVPSGRPFTVHMEGGDQATEPHVDAQTSVNCQLLSIDAADAGYRAQLQTEGDGGVCRVVFPDDGLGTVNLSVVVAGPTVVDYEVLAATPRTDSCGDGRTQMSCPVAVPEGASVRFEAMEVPNGFPVWSGLCEADPDQPWRAELGAAQDDGFCRLQVDPEDPDDCADATHPQIRILHDGELVPVDEIFARIPASSPARVDLEVDMVDVPPASYRWEVQRGGVFRELGTARNLYDQELSCDPGASCVLRFTVLDACGERRADLAYFLEAP
jgi:hypothetical protein